MRYQQVYGASDFSAIAEGGGWITAFEFFRASPGGSIDARIPDIEIRFSTTQRPPDALSSQFHGNVGQDERVVIGRGPMTFITGFDAFLPFSTPFYYNPAAGNLLMDVRIYAQPSVANFGFLEAHTVAGDSVSIVLSFSVENSVADQVNTTGLVTLFQVTPVPEPGAVTLWLAGLGLLAVAHLKVFKRISR
jgi:hypothetical protein